MVGPEGGSVSRISARPYDSLQERLDEFRTRPADVPLENRREKLKTMSSPA
jgi:hypothetical protein